MDVSLITTIRSVTGPTVGSPAVRTIAAVKGLSYSAIAIRPGGEAQIDRIVIGHRSNCCPKDSAVTGYVGGRMDASANGMAVAGPLEDGPGLGL